MNAKKKLSMYKIKQMYKKIVEKGRKNEFDRLNVSILDNNDGLNKVLQIKYTSTTDNKFFNWLKNT